MGENIYIYTKQVINRWSVVLLNIRLGYKFRIAYKLMRMDIVYFNLSWTIVGLLKIKLCVTNLWLPFHRSFCPVQISDPQSCHTVLFPEIATNNV